MANKTLLILSFCGIFISQCVCQPFPTDYFSMSDLSRLRRSTANTVTSARSARINDVTVNFPQVITTSGLVRGAGTVESNAFWEIPYAQPPVGSLRFQPPQKITTPYDLINGTVNNFLQCYQFESVCATLTEEQCTINMKEDCLILNVFTPSSIDLTDSSIPSTDRLPVLFYIHGGSFTSGSGSSPDLDGRELANVTSTIVVTINYRLGPLGFLMHQQTGEMDLSGNQGLKDQQLALEWVQDNIEKFGGDKTRVTIVGNSAGGQSVMFHTLSNISRNFYTNAIQQSSPHIYSLYHPTPEMALRITDRLLQSLECTGDERACLMSSSAQQIISQTSAVANRTSFEEGNSLYDSETFFPVIDGVEFTDQPINLYKNGKWNSDKDLIIGVTTEEYDATSLTTPANFTEEEFFWANVLMLGDLALAQSAVNKYKELYPLSPGEDYRNVYGMEITDRTFLCTNRLMARFASNTTSASVYYYVFDEKILLDLCLLSGGNTQGCYFAYHTAEIELVFRTFEEVKYENYTESHLSLENQFSTYWGGFAQNGNPSSGLLNPVGSFPSWPTYNFVSSNSQSWPYMYIHSPTSEVRQGFRNEICDFWDELILGGPFDFNYTMETSSISSTTAAQSTTSHAKSLHQSMMVMLAVATVILLKILWNFVA